MAADFGTYRDGSIVILTPQTDAAREWADEHLPEDTPRWGVHGRAIGTRYIEDILHGVVQDNLTWEWI